jgi:hypothetical protein
VIYHLQEVSCENIHKRAKNVQKNKAYVPFYTSPKEEAHNPNKSGPEGMENKAKFQPTHLNSVTYRHGPSPGQHRRQPDKDGPTPPVAPIGPSFGWLVDAAFAMMVHQVMARSNAPTCQFEVGLHLPCEKEAFSKNPPFLHL